MKTTINRGYIMCKALVLYAGIYMYETFKWKPSFFYKSFRSEISALSSWTPANISEFCCYFSLLSLSAYNNSTHIYCHETHRPNFVRDDMKVFKPTIYEVQILHYM